VWDPTILWKLPKFRAARWLWAEIVDAYKPPCPNDCDNKAEDGTCRCAAKMNIHATTSRFNQTLYDPYVNLLRSQTEAMSATLGAVDSLTVRPFDETFETPSDFAERIAVNQQLLLKEESHFDKITDPSAGSYYIETLTHSLAQQAWKLFLDTEETGFYPALKAGIVQEAINVSADARFKALANRKEILLGTNQYPNFTETAVEKLKIERQMFPITVTTMNLLRSGCSTRDVLPIHSMNCGWKPKKAERDPKCLC